MPAFNILRAVSLLSSAALLAGCNTVVLNPSGDIAAQQARLVVISTLLMLLIIVPVIVLTFMFAWRYRQGNTDAPYKPDWDHSIQLELVIWAAPLLIIIALGAVTWISTHTLDPFRKLARIDAQRPVPSGVQPLVVEVVALDWKWLFLYPQHGIAVVNELAAPVDVPIEFKITSSSVMNTLYIPALAGMIYAMPGMQSKLYAVINQPGRYDGFSANYSGPGFTDMRFKFHGLSAADFERWVQSSKGGTESLTRQGYLQLERPSEREPVRRYASYAPDLWRAIINRCVEAGKPCLHERMAADERARRMARAEWGARPGEPVQLASSAAFGGPAVCTADDPTGAGLSLSVRD